MASLVIPTLASLTAEVEDLRARADRLASGLTRSQFNWQPDDGRKWSVGQCFDHLARANTLYLEAVTRAIDAAPRRPTDQPLTARANALGRWFIATLEPPSRVAMRAPKAIQPVSDLDPADAHRRFGDSLVVLRSVLGRAWSVDPNRTRFRNPLAWGWCLFNVTAALQIMTAHSRRHLWQAEQVRARAEWPRD
jgi:hypothetical protein